MQKKLPVPIGRTNYKKICDHNYYVDKTLLIRDALDEGVDVLLFTRPRRFGKTLNMDMLRTFFEKTEQDNSRYFVDKKIWQEGEEYTRHQGKYPVIYLSLKDVKAHDWPTALELLQNVISVEYARHHELAESTALSALDADLYKTIATGRGTEAEYMLSLQALTRMLYAHHKREAVIIIDEYDTPIQEGYMNGYYDKAVGFIRTLFSAAFKDNPYISLCFLTGILRVAKESIFSGLNNIRVFSVLDKKFSNYFGFTADETMAMAAYYNAADEYEELKNWYDGYHFGETEIFNPWSVINFFSNECKPMAYWVQTSANSIIHELLKVNNVSTYENLKNLLRGISVESVIETDTIYPQLKDSQTNLLGFLLMTGYLKATKTVIKDGFYVCELSIPNKEIKTIYRKELPFVIKM